MEEMLQQFRSQAAQFGLGVRGTRYPKELVALGRAYFDGRHAAGVSVATVAQELGVAVPTLKRWCQAAEGSDAVADFKRVTVIPSSRATGLVLSTPAGWRLEGLDFDTAVALLRALS